MKQLNEEQLNMRIESFIARKHQQYPELDLRGDKKRNESIGYMITDKITELAAAIRLRRFA